MTVKLSVTLLRARLGAAAEQQDGRGISRKLLQWQRVETCRLGQGICRRQLEREERKEQGESVP